MRFEKKDLDRIYREISKAEDKTSAEIVVVMSEKSDEYTYVPLLWGALLAFFVPLPLFYFSKLTGPEIYIIQLCVFCVLAILLSFPFIIMHVVPESLKKKRCHRRAMEQFLTQNLHTTKGRTGVLIYVSEFEHYCEIIADQGIYEKFDKDHWQDEVDNLTRHIARGKIVDGFVGAIRSCGRDLAKHYPAGSENPNELPNHLILL